MELPNATEDDVARVLEKTLPLEKPDPDPEVVMLWDRPSDTPIDDAAAKHKLCIRFRHGFEYSDVAGTAADGGYAQDNMGPVEEEST